MTEKWATPEGTEKFFQWKQIDASKRRLFEGLSLSALGVGTRMGAEDELTDKLYEEALVEAALSGINSFDTAPHYRNQRSEKGLGKAIRELGNRGIFRHQLFISTKGGVIGPDEAALLPSEEVIEGSYCMSASFLERQIGTSLKNLHIGSIDLYLLQDPEIALVALGEPLFYMKLEEAFRFLEQQVASGAIRRYGIATWNGFRVKPHSKGRLSLLKILECAKKAGGEKHHFKVIQAPFNLIMSELLTVKNPADPPFLQAAKEHGVALFACTALMQGQVQRLPQRLYDSLPPASSKVEKALEFILATPGILAAHVGMKTALHVGENSKILQTSQWTSEVWQAASTLLGIKHG